MKKVFVLDFDSSYDFLDLPNLPYEMDQPWSSLQATEFLYGLIHEALDDQDSWIEGLTSCELIAASLGDIPEGLEGYGKEITSLKPYIDQELIMKASLYLKAVLNDPEYFNEIVVDDEQSKQWTERLLILREIFSTK